MSREASRLGRRPKRPKDEPSDLNSPSFKLEKSFKQADSLAPLNSPSTNTKVKKEKNQETLTRNNSLQPLPPFKLDAQPAAKQPMDSQARQLLSEFSHVQKKRSQNEHKGQMQHIEMLTKLVSVSDRHTSIERSNELEFIRSAIIEAHCQIWPTTFEKIRYRYLERPPVRANNNNNLNANNHEIIWDTFVDAMVPLIMNVVKYCKFIPGFNQILQHDQVSGFSLSSYM